jgi:hypothetical protein
MGIPEDPIPDPLEVLAKVGFGVESRAGVVQIDVPLAVQPTVFGRAQLIQVG